MRPVDDERTPVMKQDSAEFVGTYWLALDGCGCAVLFVGTWVYRFVGSEDS